MRKFLLIPIRKRVHIPIDSLFRACTDHFLGVIRVKQTMTIYRRDSVKVFQILSGRLNPNEINSLVQTQLLVLELNKDVLAWSNLNAGMATSFRSDVSKERRGGKLI